MECNVSHSLVSEVLEYRGRIVDCGGFPGGV